MDARLEPAATGGMTAGSKFRKGFRAVWRYRASYVLLLPGILYFLMFKYYPMLGVIIAFKDHSLTDGIWNSPWTDPWFKHFKSFYDSPYFSQVIGNTFIISFYRLAWGLAPPVLLALLLNECKAVWFRKWVQTLSYLPHFLSWVIIYGILLSFLSQDAGLINRWLKQVGMDSIPFLTSTEWFRTVLVSSNIWQDLGWGAIIYLAAIAGINPVLYEAARVDGGGRLRMIWHITLPGIRNIFIVLLILKLGHIMDAGFDQIYIMYNPLVYSVSDIVDTWVFRNGLERMNYSIASAVGLFKSVIGLLLVYGSNRLARKWGEGLW